MKMFSYALLMRTLELFLISVVRILSLNDIKGCRSVFLVFLCGEKVQLFLTIFFGGEQNSHLSLLIFPIDFLFFFEFSSVLRFSSFVSICIFDILLCGCCTVFSCVRISYSFYVFIGSTVFFSTNKAYTLLFNILFSS